MNANKWGTAMGKASPQQFSSRILLGQWNAEITIEKLNIQGLQLSSKTYKTQQVTLKTWHYMQGGWMDRYDCH